MSSVYDNVLKYPNLQQFAEWAIMTNNNIKVGDRNTTLIYPEFPKDYFRVNQEYLLNGDLVVRNDSPNEYDYYRYI